MSAMTASTTGSGWPTVPAEIPVRMSAVVFDRFGPPEVLRVAAVDTPVPGDGEVLVRVAAVAVGRFLDIALRAGTHPVRPALPHTPGVEHAGTVAAVGPGVTDLAVGQRVAVWPVLGCGVCAACAVGRSEACPELTIAGVHGRGTDSEYSCVPAAAVYPVPDDLDPTTAASLALAGPVAMNQIQQAGMQPGDWVLVQGAASALGSTTVALAHHLGARVIGTSRAAWKRDRLLALGVDAALDPTADDVVATVRTLTGGAGVAVAIDDLGEPVLFATTMDVLAPCGVVVSSGAFLGGRASIDLARLYTLNQRILGVRTGNRASALALWEEVARGFRPVVDRVFPIGAVAQAHGYLEADENMGRVVLTAGAPEDWETP
jgi:NADPH:quinone reductase-like Zn-dependent oxidoreductase